MVFGIHIGPLSKDYNWHIKKKKYFLQMGEFGHTDY